MADFADVADDVIAQHLVNKLQALPKFDAPSNMECEECGEVIPEQRRKLGGVTLCIGCQTEVERTAKQFGARR